MFTEVGLRARPKRAIGQRGQACAVIGGAVGLAEAGRGWKVTGVMAAAPQLRDRLSFLHRVSAGSLALLRALSPGSARISAAHLRGPSGVTALRLLPSIPF